VERVKILVAVHAELSRNEIMGIFTLNTQAPPSFEMHPPTRPHTGLRRLFAAAIVNDQFCETLLSKPEEALANGYLGQTFALTDHEKMVIKSVRADTLTDFAQKVNRALKGG
jgi:hypothetical protein